MQLRSEDPLSLKQIIAMTTASAAASSGRVAGSAASARIDFLSDVRLLLVDDFVQFFHDFIRIYHHVSFLRFFLK
jgi:hypothetical protein